MFLCPLQRNMETWKTGKGRIMKNFRMRWYMAAGWVMGGMAIGCFVYGHILLGLALAVCAVHAVYTQFRGHFFARMLAAAEEAELQDDQIAMMEILGKLNRGEIRRVNKHLCLFDVAIANGWNSVGKLLLRRCPLPTSRTPLGNTALHIVVAFSRSGTQFCDALKGAVDINIRNFNGQTPMDVAAMFDQGVFMNALARNGGKNAVELPEEATFISRKK